ncbi:MAG: RagB/SusD family nutrient uptake outer membrane protein [Bacteroidetes bacterium]|nr:MAG: RagB/SusD family nutrient uptake outer membrane protein [Bacteroidota bacterium]
MYFIMKTKNVSIFLIFSMLAAMIVVSCDDFLDIEPQLAVSDDAVYDSHDGVLNALYGAWDRTAGPQLYAGSSIFFSDLLASSGQIAWSGTFIQYEQMEGKNMDPNSGNIAAIWNRSYWIIDLVNNVLDNLDVVNEDVRPIVEGEARFIRGILYFELVRLFGRAYTDGDPAVNPGVPLVLTPTAGITDADFRPRETVANVYASLINDLVSSRNLLAGFTTYGANNGRATASTAAAFLSRVYMTMENWEAAANQASFVVENFEGYGALRNTPRQAYNNDSYTTEDVFMIIQDATSNAGQANDGIGTFFASLDGYGRSDIDIKPMHLAMFEEGDLRALIDTVPDAVDIGDINRMLYLGVGRKAGRIQTSKWGKHDANINVIRLAEMILIRAEANFRNGSSIGAQPLNDINAIRLRAGVGAWDNLTLEMIREERYREMCFEGRLMEDVRRFREDVVIPEGPADAGTVLPWNSPRMVLPIPQREIDVNPNLVQNEAYN